MATKKKSRTKSKVRATKVSANAVVVEQPPLWYRFSKWLLGVLGAALAPLLALLFFFVLFSLAMGGDDGIVHDGNVAVIAINGPIISDSSVAGFGFQGTTATDTLKLIKRAEENKDIEAIIFEINSPGGTAVGSAEIANAVRDSNKTTVAVIREVGASGAFWIASATDRVYAHELSITGSIGVISSYLEFAGLLDQYNVTYRRLVSGKYKDIGSPFKEMTAEEQALFQDRIDRIHDVFIREVANNRKLPEEVVREDADGFVFLGEDAVKKGFVDELGGMKEAKAYLEESKGISVKAVSYKPKKGLLAAFSQVISDPFYKVGVGIGDSFKVSGNGGVPQVRY